MYLFIKRNVTGTNSGMSIQQMQEICLNYYHFSSGEGDMGQLNRMITVAQQGKRKKTEVTIWISIKSDRSCNKERDCTKWKSVKTNFKKESTVRGSNLDICNER